MGGERYYTFKKGAIDFFALDSNYMDPKQLQWVQDSLQKSTAKWKICYFHHPLFNAGKAHGPDLDLRSRLLPLFRQFGVDAVFSGHEHVDERVKPEDNIYFFVEGSSGKLNMHDLRSSDQQITGKRGIASALR
jgi:3',5'-cyclic AMP phosphodiesterase CpdA